MTTVLGLAFAGLFIWGTYSFWASGRYSAHRPPPTLRDFQPGPDQATRPSDNAEG
jgi:hypothetical protein